jgi:hypothetical protein
MTNDGPYVAIIGALVGLVAGLIVTLIREWRVQDIENERTNGIIRELNARRVVNIHLANGEVVKHEEPHRERIH